MRNEILRMERVTYTNKSGVVLQNFSLQIFAGEIMGLLPINAYGLAELLDVLRYNYTLYDGYIYYREKKVNSWKDGRREEGKISFVRDKSILIEGQRVVDSIFVLRPGFRQEILPNKLLCKQLQPFLEEIDLAIEPDTMVEKLSQFERIAIEILRAVVAGNKLIVIQEISTMISEKELVKLRKIIRYYTTQGFAFLYISPHFEDILQICSRTAIMKDGRIIKILEGQDMRRETIQAYSEEYKHMVRHRLERRQELEKEPVVLELKDIRGDYIKGLNFFVRRGECVVLQLLDNNIGSELLDMLLGNKVLKGKSYLNEKEIILSHNREVAVVQENPTKSMLFYGMSYMDNLCFTIDHRIDGVWRNNKIRKNIKEEYSSVLGENVFEKQLQELTELEKYNLVYMRILLQKPQVLFCIFPFKGADMVHRIRIWELQEMFLKKGIAVVILSVNMSDTLSLADRVIRIHKKAYTEEYLRKDFGKLPRYIPWQYLYEEERH